MTVLTAEPITATGLPKTDSVEETAVPDHDSIGKIQY